ncbi:Putative membrane protein, conserved [Thermococcus nautili]|uniref:COG1470 family protein n=1 Tax=Thermococcus nautili TaxID=195522 RepID=UPI0025578F7D|nr:NEW3 domain-containing protein [Thermococcus nautili]CAI1493992.1 Putative membrane protein, conserved [Thermococcus nautili]
MRFKLCALLIVTLLLVHMPAVSSEGSSLLSVTVLNDTIPALPGSTVVVPFSITNLGNETINNVTVYVTGPAQGFQYSVKVIRTPIEPGKSVNDTITVNVLNVPPGKYNLTLVARAGNFYSTAKFVVSVGVLSDYSLSVEVGSRYIYGNDVVITLKAISKSNGVLLGSLGYKIVREGVILKSYENSTYLNPGEVWEKVIVLKKPDVGNYTVVLWANFGGKYKRVVKTFEVYQRKLQYEVYFRDGAIYVRVFNSTGGVPGIAVSIDNVTFKTDVDGEVSYLVNEPGVYRVTLNLDGRIVTTFVDVKKLIVSPRVLNGSIVVRVMDSTGVPVPNVTVVASGPLGTDYSVTNSSGIAVVNLNKTGYGSIVIKAESDRYLPGEAVITVSKPAPKTSTTRTPTNTSPVNSTAPVLPTTSGTTAGSSSHLGIILILAGLILAGTSYLAFAVPIVHEETLDRYYFLKVRAPKLRPLKNYRVERAVNAVEVRVTRGNAKLENGKLVWELDLEPGEEAYLQAVLG